VQTINITYRVHSRAHCLLESHISEIMHILATVFFITFLLTFNPGAAAPLFACDPCEATTWRDIFLFYLLNYFTHAATALSPPGARSWVIFKSQLICLLYPFHGLLRAVSLLFSHCVFGTDELGSALAVGALTVVSRTKTWKPLPNVVRSYSAPICRTSSSRLDVQRRMRRPKSPNRRMTSENVIFYTDNFY